MIKASIISLLVCAMSACSNTYKLSAGDIEWNPYKGNEVLVFKNNEGHIDTIFVQGIERTKIGEDNLALIPDHYEILNVIVNHTMPGSKEQMKHSFFELHGVKGRNTIIGFRLLAKNAVFYAGSYYKNELEKLTVSSLKTQNFTYKDVIKLEPQSIEYYERDEFVTAVYWSKSKGYIRYDLKNGVYWELQ